MVKYLLIIGLGSASLAGCAPHDSRQGDAPNSTISLSRVTTTTDATRVANLLVHTKGLEWGIPVQIKWQEEHNRFLVIYATPEKERLMGGDRGVFVETNGQVWVIPQL